jgi:hypothetical protein
MICRSSVRVSARLVASLTGAFLAVACSDGQGPATAGPPGLLKLHGALDLPIFAASPPGDTHRLFVVEQTGRIRMLKDDVMLAAPFLDLSTVVSCCGERGLLGLAFHPQYTTNGLFYVYYTNTSGDTRVMRYHVSANPDVADPTSAGPVLSQTQPFANHNGGMLAFGPDGYLYVGLGDGGSGGDPLNHAQNRSSLLGKVLRLDVDHGAPYTVPADNPFVGQAGTRPEIWSLGLRNPWRFSFDRQTGEMYIGDVGQDQWEEIDVEPAAAGGRNYGWHDMEGGVCYLPACTPTGLTLPAWTYPHSEGCSVTGGYVYRGATVPALSGLYLFADYCNGWVRSFRWTAGNATAVTDQPALAPGGPISSFGEDARGELYILEYGAPGALYRIISGP